MSIPSQHKPILPLGESSQGSDIRYPVRLLIFLKSEDARTTLIDSLAPSDRFTFDVPTDISKCLAAVAENSHDVLMTDFIDLDLGLRQTVEKFRNGSTLLAVIFLRQNTDDMDEIEALNQGVDWVITSPLNAPLALARIEALMRWKNLSPYNTPQIGPFQFNVETKRLSNQRLGDIRITDKEVRILEFLLLHKGKIVSRSDLLEHVWGYSDSAKTHTVETHIYRLRKKIERVADSKSIIITEVGGYRLVK